MRVVKSLLQRCADVVSFMAASPGPCRLSAIAGALDLPKSAVHRLLREMCSLGWVQQEGDDGPYALTLRFALLGHRVLHASRLPDLVQPVLDGLARQSRELVRLTMATDDGLVWIAAAQGAPPGLLYQPAIEDPVVLHATANGKAYLAALPTEAALLLAKQGGLGTLHPTSRTRTTEAALLADLADIRTQGYAVVSGEAEDGITAVARIVPAPSSQGARIFGTVSIAGPSLRLPASGIADLARLLDETARTLAGIWPDAAIALTKPQGSRA
jgi:DNA-binding IclR family transcriptional regulator